MKLTSDQRKKLPAASFALPGRRYPIEDKNHARNALARVSQHGDSSEKARVRAAVARKFPEMQRLAAGGQVFPPVSGGATPTFQWTSGPEIPPTPPVRQPPIYSPPAQFIPPGGGRPPIVGQPPIMPIGGGGVPRRTFSRGGVIPGEQGFSGSRPVRPKVAQFPNLAKMYAGRIKGYAQGGPVEFPIPVPAVVPPSVMPGGFYGPSGPGPTPVPTPVATPTPIITGSPGVPADFPQPPAGQPIVQVDPGQPPAGFGDLVPPPDQPPIDPATGQPVPVPADNTTRAPAAVPNYAGTNPLPSVNGYPSRGFTGMSFGPGMFGNLNAAQPGGIPLGVGRGDINFASAPGEGAEGGAKGRSGIELTDAQLAALNPTRAVQPVTYDPHYWASRARASNAFSSASGQQRGAYTSSGAPRPSLHPLPPHLRRGGVIGAMSGRVVPGPRSIRRDIVPIMAKPGEVVLNRGEQRQVTPLPGLRSDLVRAIMSARARKPQFAMA